MIFHGGMTETRPESGGASTAITYHNLYLKQYRNFHNVHKFHAFYITYLTIL